VPRVTEERHGSASLDRLASVDLNLLVPLLALLEECSVTKAAARVGLSQPAMSHALSRLRRLLSDDLLVRQGASMTITPRAAELIVPLRRTLDQVAHVVRFPGFDPTTDRRVVTVALTMSTAFELGGPLARFVAERAPLATLRLHTITVPDDSLFTTHGVDVALLPEAFASPFPRERLYDDRWVVVAAKDAAPADAATIDLLRTLPHVAFESSGRRVLPYAVLDERRLPYTVRQLVPDNLLIPALVAHVGGVALHRHRVVTAMSALFPLRIEEFPYPVPGLGYDMVWNPRLGDDTFVSWLRGILHEAAGGL